MSEGQRVIEEFLRMRNHKKYTLLLLLIYRDCCIFKYAFLKKDRLQNPLFTSKDTAVATADDT